MPTEPKKRERETFFASCKKRKHSAVEKLLFLFLFYKNAFKYLLLFQIWTLLVAAALLCFLAAVGVLNEDDKSVQSIPVSTEDLPQHFVEVQVPGCGCKKWVQQTARKRHKVTRGQ